jgi:hypothetical protein
MDHELAALVGRYSVSHVCLSDLSFSLVNIGREQQESSIDESGSEHPKLMRAAARAAHGGRAMATSPPLHSQGGLLWLLLVQPHCYEDRPPRRPSPPAV